MVGSSGSAGFRVTLYVGKRRRSGLDRRDAESRALLEPRDDLGDVARGRAHQGRRDALQVMCEEGARARAGEAVGRAVAASCEAARAGQQLQVCESLRRDAARW